MAIARPSPPKPPIAWIITVMLHRRRATPDGRPAIVCIVRRAALCDPVCPSPSNGTTEPAAGPRTPRGVGRGLRPSKAKHRLFCPGSVALPSGLTIVPSVTQSAGGHPGCRHELEAGNGMARRCFCLCQSSPSWCRRKRRIRSPTPRPVKASDPVGSAVRGEGGGKGSMGLGFAPDLTVTSQTSGPAHGGRPQSQRGARVCSQHQLT